MRKSTRFDGVADVVKLAAHFLGFERIHIIVYREGLPD
jgi:hypothetical protein